MKKEKLFKIDKIVEEILRKDELARKDDCYLILEVVRRMYPFEVGKTFADVMFNAKSKGISFESITRARRKVQQDYPELADEKVTEIRKEETQEYVDYATEKR